MSRRSNVATPPIFSVLRVLAFWTKGRAPRHWTARCPSCHTDPKSLHVIWGDNGQVGLRCIYGCAEDAILGALGAQQSDLYPHGNPAFSQPGKAARPLAPKRKRFPLRDAAHHLVAILLVHEWPPRDGVTRVSSDYLDPKGLVLDPGDEVPIDTFPLYGLPRLLKTRPGACVYLCATVLGAEELRSRNIVAVGLPVAWVSDLVPQDDFLRPLVPYAIVLWPLNDPVSRATMLSIAERLRALGGTPEWVEWPNARQGAGPGDFFGCGYTLDDLQALVVEAPNGRDTHEEEGAESGC